MLATAEPAAAGAPPTPAAAPPLDELELGRVELRPPPAEEFRDGGGPPPRKPPPGDDGRFPRFRGGGGNGLPRWQRIAIFGVMLVLSALVGMLIGQSALVFARGLEAGRHGN